MNNSLHCTSIFRVLAICSRWIYARTCFGNSQHTASLKRTNKPTELTTQSAQEFHKVWILHKLSNRCTQMLNYKCAECTITHRKRMQCRHEHVWFFEAEPPCIKKQLSVGLLKKQKIVRWSCDTPRIFHFISDWVLFWDFGKWAGVPRPSPPPFVSQV